MEATVIAVAVLEIRKALLARHGEKLSINDGEKFLETVSFLNFNCESYFPVIGKELMAFFQHLAIYCKDASV